MHLAKSFLAFCDVAVASDVIYTREEPGQASLVRVCFHAWHNLPVTEQLSMGPV